MAIRILHVVEGLGVGGGVETGIANLIQRMDPDRFEHVLCGVFRLGTQLNRYPRDRVRLICLEQKARKLSIQAVALARLIREVKPDVVHSRNWGALEAVFAGRWVGACPVIHSEHGFEVDPATEPRRRNLFRRFAFEMADQVFSVSEQLRDLLARGTGFPARRIEVIHNGVDMTHFRQDRAARSACRRELGIAEDEFCIGCVGRLNHIKDYPTMLRAAEILSRSRNSWRLLIAGAGTELPHLEEFVRANPGLRERVRFLGPCDRVPEFLNAIDVYVLPSISEGISNSLLEAMATGVPVMASDVGGNPEVVVDGTSGILFPVGDFRQLTDRLLFLSNQGALRSQLAENARRRIEEEFSVDLMIRRYEEMYAGVTRDRRAASRQVENALCRRQS